MVESEVDGWRCVAVREKAWLASGCGLRTNFAVGQVFRPYRVDACGMVVAAGATVGGDQRRIILVAVYAFGRVGGAAWLLGTSFGVAVA